MKKKLFPDVLVICFGSVFFLLSIYAFNSTTTNNSIPNDLKDTIINLEKQSWEAWKNRDATFYQHFLSDDHVEMGAGGASNKQEVVEIVGDTACKVKNYTVDKFELSS